MKEKIAIIGLGCVFPDALDFTQYWQNIVEGRNSIREVDPQFWRAEDFYDPDPTAPDRTYCKVGGMAGPIEFDTKEFGVSPKVMEHTSVEQLFSLVVARQAMIDAGLYGKNARPYNKEKTGVIISAPAGTNTGPLSCRNMAPNIRKILVNNGIPAAAADLIVEKYLQSLNNWTEDDNPGYIANVVAGRIANRFDFGGTSCSVDAACGSSLGAIKFAVDELQNGNCDVMLCGGANLDNSAFAYISFCKTPAISKTSKIKPFDEKADGMILGDGVGMMVLKRLSDAERDGDKIYAVICGCGSSSDGRATSIYAPSKEGQVRALTRAYETSGVDMDTIGLLEAHGTGTAAGDACEVSAVVEAFPKSNKRKTVIGSVKSQVGHMRMAAGIGGAMKIALALYHKVLPNSINMDNPNPALLDSRLTVLKKSMPWIVNDEQPVRRAGCSAFGFGGTNFHVVMEEYKPEQGGAYRVGSSPVGVVFTADSKDGLVTKIEALASDANAFRNDDYRYENVGTGPFRLAFVANSPGEVAEKCAAALALLAKSDADSFTQKGIAYNARAIDSKVTVLFPGQGTQAVNMLSEAAINYPELRHAIGTADNVLLRKGGAPISEILYPKALTDDELAAAQTAINNTANTQPALAAVEAGLYEIVTKRGLKADAFIGHSFGELVALWADGVMDYDTLIDMAQVRGRLMSQTDPHAAMMACMTSKENITAICADLENVYIANENSPGQTVVSGSADAINKLAEKLNAMGIRAVALKVSGAFHSPYMKEASVAFREYLDGLKLNKPTGSVIANATGTTYTQDVADLLEKQLLNPVLFRTSVEKAYADGSRIFVEIGNGKVLSNLVKDCLTGKDVACVSLCPEKGKNTAEQLEFAMAQLAVLGIHVLDDPYRAPHNDDLIIKKSKTTYTVNMKAFHLPQKQKLMDDALLPDHRIIDMIKISQEPQTSVIPKDACSVNGEVFRRFTEVQTAQMQAAANILSKATTESEKLNALRCISLFQDNAMRAYEAYFNSQQGASVPCSTPAAPVITAPVPVIDASVAMEPPAGTDVSAILLDAIADKTGYPIDMIDEEMELEADLGIDSIKRVEILSTVNIALGGVINKDNVEELSGIGKISDMVSFLNSISVSSVVTDPPAAGIDLNAIVIDAISDKTGYPTDMIESDMELEADLGIDSIKRVEIFSAIFTTLERTPSADEIGELSALTDIQSIVAYLADKT
jgi:polyketide-type polyunsaturated fatty acid synthase PfaA